VPVTELVHPELIPQLCVGQLHQRNATNLVEGKRSHVLAQSE
jgi:hypothetical protein